MTGASEAVTAEVVADGTVVVTMRRPARRNAMNVELVDALHHTFGSLADDQSCRVIVLTGEGTGFCSGMDLTGYGRLPSQAGKGRVQRSFLAQRHLATLVTRFRAQPQPIIAAVNGPAIGGGLGLVLGCDIRMASSTATFSAAPIKIGLSACDIGISWFLPRLVGAGRAHELMLTGRVFGADDALAMGLVVSVDEPGALLDAAVAKATEITENSPFGVLMTKAVMWSSMEIPGLQAAIDLEDRTQTLAAMTEDHVEAATARLEKRPARFTAR